MRCTVWLSVQRLGIAAVVAAAAMVLSPVAHAQFFGDRFGYDRPPPPPPSGGFFNFPFFGHPINPPYAPPQRTAPAESYKAPPPHKPAAEPARTVLVIGDSLGDWLGYGLEEIYADSADLGVERKIRTMLGLVRTEPRSDTPEWTELLKDIPPTDKPSAIVVMLGLSDRLPLRVPLPPRAGEKPAQAANQPAPQPPSGPPPPQGPDAKPAAAAPPADAAPAAHLVPGATYEFRSAQWAELYKARIDEMIAALKARGVPVLWVGLPAIRGTRGTSDMNYLDDLYRANAERAGIVYVDVWNGFVDENGRYAVSGPDFEGQTRRLRTGDGVHFTKYGALKLAHLVDQELGRALSIRTAPVAVPAPQASAPATKPTGAPPAVGPVLPLSPGGGDDDSGQLAGGGARPPASDPVAERVLVHGGAVTAPPGRADDFSWPPDAHAKAAPAAPPSGPALPSRDKHGSLAPQPSLRAASAAIAPAGR